MSHTAHAPIPEAGLADYCPRCAEHAEHPISSLDTPNLRALVQRTLRSRFGGVRPSGVSPFGYAASPRTQAEGLACARVLDALEQAARLIEAAPADVELYLRERWNLNVRIGGPEVEIRRYDHA